MSIGESGFAITSRVFDPYELSPIRSCLEQKAFAQGSKAGSRHLLQLPEVRAIVSDRRLIEWATEILGAEAIPFGATLFNKLAKTNWLVTWHQDRALPVRRRVNAIGWGPWSSKDGVLYANAPACVLQGIVALRVHIDDSTSASGPLRVLPGTHRGGVLSTEAIECASHQINAVECLAPAGGVVAMRPLLLHASSKSTAQCQRRVLHIQYTARIEVAPDLELEVV